MRTTELQLLFCQLRRVESGLRGLLNARLTSECGLVVGQFEALSVIASHKRCRVRDVADELSLTTGGASKLIYRVESAGLCRRRPNADDRRSTVIELTPGGRTLLSKASETVDEALFAHIGSTLSPTSLRHLATLAETLRATTTLGT
jgi:MarR family transcriptional regulator, organic hydroperoxide resistance regulator